MDLPPTRSFARADLRYRKQRGLTHLSDVEVQTNKKTRSAGMTGNNMSHDLTGHGLREGVEEIMFECGNPCTYQSSYSRILSRSNDMYGKQLQSQCNSEACHFRLCNMVTRTPEYTEVRSSIRGRRSFTCDDACENDAREVRV